ncbi:uncharacterized protein B0P05DRAFT_558678 [Gilbertella persicaria]|uniref:uncharacterized protein n=1 Tax=Gilbertella persicaria TaxID=101096 RepID=UPI0022207CEF|nr:uncharacterized protein B0P05DRAFT_558678 [Gilbertella persicaria]KAI8059430.1 hypothetical protein B0P05DRAFT_558678 [Gilbertella persicaria]
MNFHMTTYSNFSKNWLNKCVFFRMCIIFVFNTCVYIIVDAIGIHIKLKSSNNSVKTIYSV